MLLITGLLVRSVHRLGIAQRHGSFSLLHRFGVPRQRITQWLTLELLVLTGICVVPGLWLGAKLAGMLGSGFGQALDSLFDVAVYAGAEEALPGGPPHRGLSGAGGLSGGLGGPGALAGDGWPGPGANDCLPDVSGRVGGVALAPALAGSLSRRRWCLRAPVG